METAIATGKILVIGAVTLCLMGAVPIVYAESTSAGTGNGGHPGMSKDQIYHSQLVKLRADITAGDQEKVNRDVEVLIEEILGETPMVAPEMKADVPEAPSETQEFQGYESGA